MLHAAELLRFGEALICSGVFWATFLFLMNACALNRRVSFIGVGAAVGVLSLTAPTPMNDTRRLSAQAEIYCRCSGEPPCLPHQACSMRSSPSSTAEFSG